MDFSSLIEVRVGLGKWQQWIELPTTSPQLWDKVANQIEPTLTQLPIDTQFQQGLAQELTCLLVYVGQLFNLDKMAEHFAALERSTPL